MMNQVKFAFLLLVFYAILFPKEAHAYLDPGTGSYILQIIAAVFFAGIFVAKQWWNQIKNVFSRILGRKDDKKSEKSD